MIALCAYENVDKPALTSLGACLRLSVKMTAALTELLHLQEFMPQVTVLPRVQSDASTWLFQHCKSKKFTNVNQEGDTV